MKKLCFLILMFFTCGVCDAQNPNIKRTWHWYFGIFAGIDFSSGIAVLDTMGMLTAPEGCASISDTSGNLLFYTDGKKIWNKNHQLMPNGTGLLGGQNGSSTQSSLILPQPSSSNLFYLFTTDENPGTYGMRYSIIDLNLDSGNGDVTSTKNVLLFAPSAEKLSAVNHCNDTSIWIAGHGIGSNAFYAYLLGTVGLDTIPVISYVGTSISFPGLNPPAGQFKFSPDGRLAANAVFEMGGAELFKFDNYSGTFSNPILLSTLEYRNYGLEFSRNSKYLYSSNIIFQKLYQYDISNYDSIIIVNSRVLIVDSLLHGLGSMQMASDGKIYLSSSTLLKKISVINYPDSLGVGCNFCDTCFNVYPGTGPYHRVNLGLQNFNCSYFRNGYGNGCSTGILQLQNYKVKNFPNPARDWIVLEGKGIKSVEITNALGSYIDFYPTTTSALQHSINISSLSRGIYFLKINMLDEHFQFQKLIVQN